MVHQVDAVYEDGVLRPLERLPLAQSQRVRLIVSDEAQSHPLLDRSVLEQARDEVARMHHVPTIEEVRSVLSTISGSMSEFVIQERGDY